jgi:hypothetical protein
LGRSKVVRRNVRLSVALDEAEYSELSRLGAALDLSAAWMIRRAVSEFIARHRDNLEPTLPLQRATSMPVRGRKAGGSGGR